MRKKTGALIILPLFAAAAIMAQSCSKDEPKNAAQIESAPSVSEGAPSSAAVALLPEEPRAGTMLRAVVTGGASEVRWERNGEPLMAAGETLRTDGFKKGDVIRAVIGLPGAGKSAETVLVNAPPVIRSVRISPRPFHKGDDITAEPLGFDPDGDAVSYRYEWTVNGESVYGADGQSLPSGSFVRGDEVAVRVIARDSESAGEAFKAVAGRAENAPPKFTSKPPADFTGRFVYAPTAADPDGDAIALSIEKGPEGMKLENNAVDWRAAAGQAGTFEVTIAADDGNGGSVLQTFELRIGQ